MLSIDGGSPVPFRVLKKEDDGQEPVSDEVRDPARFNQAEGRDEKHASLNRGRPSQEPPLNSRTQGQGSKKT